MSIQPTSVDLVVQTTSDKKINQAKHIYAITERFTDATAVLEDLCSAVCDLAYSRSKLLQDVTLVKKFIIPLLKDSIKPLPQLLRFCRRLLE
jgi:hypothetical protein